MIEDGARASVLKILHYNVQGLRRNKIHEFDTFLIDKDFDLLCVNEHWLSNDELDSSITLSGFVCVGLLQSEPSSRRHCAVCCTEI